MTSRWSHPTGHSAIPDPVVATGQHVGRLLCTTPVVALSRVQANAVQFPERGHRERHRKAHASYAWAVTTVALVSPQTVSLSRVTRSSFSRSIPSVAPKATWRRKHRDVADILEPPLGS